MESTERIELTDTQLVERVRDGCTESMSLLIRRYSLIIYRLARPYYIKGAEREDLWQEGYIGLYKAVRTYKFERSVPFGSFAEICITASIQNAVKYGNRQKHNILNRAISLNAPISYESEEEWVNRIPDRVTNLVEEQIITAERVNAILMTLKRELSPFEYSVALMQSHSFGIKEIAETLGVTYKKVDNAIQRIRRKLADKL